MSMQDIRPIPSPSPGPTAAWITFLLWGFCSFFLILVNQFARVFVPLPLAFRPEGETFVAQPAGILVTVAYLALLLFAWMMTARAATHLPNSRAMLFIIGVALTAPYGTALLFRSQPGLIPPWLVYSANSLFLPLGATLVGVAVGRLFSHTNTLLASAGFAAFFDIIVVNFGTVAVLRESAPHIIAAVSVGAARAGNGPVLPMPISLTTIGPADVLFLGIFLAAIRKLALDERRTFIVGYVLLLIALLSVEFIPNISIPALVPMGVAVLIANMRYASFTREEKYAMVYGTVFAVVLAGFLVFGARSVVKRMAPPQAQSAAPSEPGQPQTAPAVPAAP